MLFRSTIVGKQGKDNVVADFLSRMDNNDECTPIEYIFPNENIFAVSTKPLWYADITNYIARGKIPPHFSYREQ